MPPLTLPAVNNPPFSGPQGSAPSPVAQSPLLVELAITPSGAADGHVDVSRSITLPAGNSPTATQLAGGALQMLRTDPMAKLLYQIRGAYLNALARLQLQQILPPPGST